VGLGKALIEVGFAVGDVDQLRLWQLGLALTQPAVDLQAAEALVVLDQPALGFAIGEVARLPGPGSGIAHRHLPGRSTKIQYPQRTSLPANQLAQLRAPKGV
jgi:hypothetical protein